MKNGMPEEARACVLLFIIVKSLVNEDSIEKAIEKRPDYSE